MRLGQASLLAICALPIMSELGRAPTERFESEQSESTAVIQRCKTNCVITAHFIGLGLISGLPSPPLERCSLAKGFLRR